MLSKKLIEALVNFRQKRIAVFGDIILDRYISGVTRRVSREAPVLILEKRDEDYNLGGAGNTIRNLKDIGARVFPVSLVGKDAYGEKIKKLLENSNIDTRYIFLSAKRSTPIKTRYYAGDNHTRKQQILRVDESDENEITSSEYDLLINALKREMSEDVDGLIISDYGAGNVTEKLIEELNGLGGRNNMFIGVDSRYRVFSFSNISFIKPNESEFCDYMGIRNTSDLNLVFDSGKNMLSKLGVDIILLTRGSEGMILFEHGRDPWIIPAFGTKDILDGTGAGDTVISVFMMGLVSGLKYRESAVLANIAGSIVVMKPNVATLAYEELEKKIVSPEFDQYIEKNLQEL